MAYINPNIITVIDDHALDLLIVDFFGLSSVMDIDQVIEQYGRYEITLEDGSKKIATKSGLAQHAATKQHSDDEIYIIKNRFDRYNGVSEFTLIDEDAQERKVIIRFASTIFQKDALVNYLNFDLQLAG